MQSNLARFIYKLPGTQSELFESIDVIERLAKYYLFFILSDYFLYLPIYITVSKF